MPGEPRWPLYFGRQVTGKSGRPRLTAGVGAARQGSTEGLWRMTVPNIDRIHCLYTERRPRRMSADITNSGAMAACLAGRADKSLSRITHRTKVDDRNDCRYVSPVRVNRSAVRRNGFSVPQPRGFVTYPGLPQQKQCPTYILIQPRLRAHK